MVTPKGRTAYPSFYSRRRCLLVLMLLAAGLAAGTAAGAAGRPRDTAAARLERAREDLRLSRATEARIAAELERLKQSGTAAPEVLEEYETYLRRVRAMVAESRRVVSRMEAALGRGKERAAPSPPASANGTSAEWNPQIPEEQTVDEVTALDQRLDQSLSAFDDWLLQKMDAIAAASAGTMRQLAEEAAASVQRLREGGVAVDTANPGSSGKAAGKTPRGNRDEEGGPEKKRTDAGGAEREEPSAASEQAGTELEKPAGQGGGSGSGPGARYDPADDDIVARQLREAAEKETDPELKKKLWKEYEEYRKNQT